MSTDYDCWREGEDEVTMEMIYATMEKNVNNVFHYENSDPYLFDYILYKAKDNLSESSYDLVYFSIPSGREFTNRSTTIAVEQDIIITEKIVVAIYPL